MHDFLRVREEHRARMDCRVAKAPRAVISVTSPAHNDWHWFVLALFISWQSPSAANPVAINQRVWRGR